VASNQLGFEQVFSSIYSIYFLIYSLPSTLSSAKYQDTCVRVFSYLFNQAAGIFFKLTLAATRHMSDAIFPATFVSSTLLVQNANS